MSRPDIILRGIQDDDGSNTLLRLAQRFQREHVGRSPRDVVIYTSADAPRRIYTCHWTRDHATVVAESHPDEG